MAGISISQGGNSHGTAEKPPPSYLGGNDNKMEHSSGSMGRKPTPDGALERQKSRSRTPGGARKPTAVKKTALPLTPGTAPIISTTASALRPSTLRASASKKTAYCIGLISFK